MKVGQPGAREAKRQIPRDVLPAQQFERDHLGEPMERQLAHERAQGMRADDHVDRFAAAPATRSDPS